MTSEENVYVLDPINPLTDKLFCDTDAILDFSEKNNLAFASSVSGYHS